MISMTVKMKDLTILALMKSLYDIFDDWVTGLNLYDRKILSVMLSVTLQKRFGIKATRAALESAWITGFNEKIRNYREFFSIKGFVQG